MPKESKTKLLKIVDKIAYIQIGSGDICLIDADNLWVLTNYPSWQKHRNHVYVSRVIPSQFGNASENINLGRLILQLVKKSNQICDHIDRNPLNNLRSNLRACYHKQNMANTSVNSLNSTGFKGVSLTKNRKLKKPFRAYITNNNRQIPLGYFEKKEEAALAYDKSARELFGEFACLNFPEEISK